MKTAKHKAAHHAAARPKASKKTTAKMKIKAKAKLTAKKTMKHKKPVRVARLPVAKWQTKPKAAASNVTPIRDRIDERVFADAHEYARRVFVRFDAAGKELVKTIAGEIGLSPYIAHFAALAAKAGKKIVNMPVSTRETGVFARFDSPTEKGMVAKAAKECTLSLSAYAAYFALEAAKAGRTMPMPIAEKKAAAS